MAENLGSSLWSPFKELSYIVRGAISQLNPGVFNDLEAALRKHKVDFTSLLQNPAKNAQSREQLKKAHTEGIVLDGRQGQQTLPKDVIEEALIVSDLFDLNEFTAMELLLAGEQEQPKFPGLSRGLVAVLLYYDGRASLFSSLELLIQARRGRAWTFELEDEVINLVTDFTNDLMANGLTKKILNNLEQLDVIAELSKLSREKALGDARHRHEVHSFLTAIRKSLALCLWTWSCQTPLSRQDCLDLLSHLKKNAATNPDGSLDDVTLTLLMACLYSIDIDYDEFLREDGEGQEEMPILQDPQYLPDIHKAVTSMEPVSSSGKNVSPVWDHLQCVLHFAWGITLRKASQRQEMQDYQELIEQDEAVVDEAIFSNVFKFLLNSVFTNKTFPKMEFFARRIHGLITDLITLMPLKVKDLRNKGDEAGRIILAHEREGVEPPKNLPRHFEDFMKMIGQLYLNDPENLGLSAEFWNTPDRPGSPRLGGSYYSFYSQKQSQKQVSLFKFVRLAGDLLPPSLYVPYLEMLQGLSNSEQSASCTFSLLKLNGNGGGGSASPVSWDHFFTSINRYYSSLRQDVRPESPFQELSKSTSYSAHGKGITPNELDGLIAVLRLTQTVAKWDENARLALYENQSWLPTILLFGLLTCSVPLTLKAECCKTLAVFAKSPEIAASLWQALEVSQIIPTITQPGTQSGGIPVELEEIESRSEQYPLTIGFLEFLSTLTSFQVPAALGSGYRAPGFDPYLEFLRDSIFLRFRARAYKDAAEKWKTASLVTKIFVSILQDHQSTQEDFVDQPVELQGGGTTLANKPPGHHLMVHMLNDSEMLNMVLSILDETPRLLNQFRPFTGKEHLEEAALNCLKLLDLMLDKQTLFLDILRTHGQGSLLATPLDQLLMGINPRTRTADHLLNIASLMIFGCTLKEHGLYAVRTLFKVVQNSNVQPQLVVLFTANQDLCRKVIHGFVECLDSDEAIPATEDLADLNIQDDVPNDERLCRIFGEVQVTIIKLLIHSLAQPAPNLAHLFLGFEVQKPISKTQLQDPGIWGSPRTCFHAVLGLLSHDSQTPQSLSIIQSFPKLAELAYELIYCLCANRDTSEPTLRYLRGTRDFFYRHLRHVPVVVREQSNSEEQLLIGQQAWLLKAVAVELRVTSINRQRSHTQRLLRLLLENMPSLFIEEDDKSEQTNFGLNASVVEHSALGLDTTSSQDQVIQGIQIRRKILTLLDSVDFSLDSPPPLNLTVLDVEMANQLIASCEQKGPRGVLVCDLKLLHGILKVELNNLQGASAIGQRAQLQQDMEAILHDAVRRNQFCLLLAARQQAFDAWRQVVEVLLISCSSEMLPTDTKEKVTEELLQELLAKLLDNTASGLLTAPAAGALLILTSMLRQCISVDQSHSISQLNSSQYIKMLDQSSLDISAKDTIGRMETQMQVPIVSLTAILRNLLGFLMGSSGAHHQVRVNLYGALLSFLQIPHRPADDPLVGGANTFFQPAQSEEFERIMAANMATIEEFGEPLRKLLCRDACEGHEIRRTLALSVMNAMLSIDKRGRWLSFLISNGYLHHFVESLAQADQLLQENLQPSPGPLRAVFVYESTMSFLIKVAEDPAGAKALLQEGILAKLAEAEFLNLRPEHDVQRFVPTNTWDYPQQEEDSFIPSMMSRFRQLLYPVLRLCQTILTSLGSKHKEASVQVLHFIVSHSDTFTSILREPNPQLKVESLQELAVVTSVLSTILGEVNYFDPTLSDVRGPAQIPIQTHLSRIHRQLLALVPRFSAIEEWFKQLKLQDVKEGMERPDVQASLRHALLEIVASLMGYCRKKVISTGASAATCEIIFTPHLTEATARDYQRQEDTSFSSLDISKPPSLGVVVRHLRQSSHEFIISLERYQQLLNKLENVEQLPAEELKELSQTRGTSSVAGKYSTKLRVHLASQTLKLRVHQRARQLALLYYGIESSLFLIWRHLEYYFLHCHPSLVGDNAYPFLISRPPPRDLKDSFSSLLGEANQQTNLDRSVVSPEALGITREDLKQLKLDATTCLNENLLKRILDIEGRYTTMRRFRYAFVTALIRRIRRLLMVDVH